MNTSSTIKRRGFVMTGGGAKGLYEAGVIHAFHIVGMEFDVITGSSIGAFNSIFYAEYLLRKRQLPIETLKDPLKTVEAMDSMVKAYHHAWLQLPEKNIIDDSQTGPLGRLKDDLLKFHINLPDIIRILWWLSDPDRNALSSPNVWPALLKIGNELKERIGGAGKLLQIFKNYRSDFIERTIRTYLSRFDMEKSLIPSEEDVKLSSVFTEPIEPLQTGHLRGGETMDPNQDSRKVALVESGRTFKDYYRAGIDVRLTRANYRTGRLEISMYLSTQDFVRYLLKQAFRLEKADPEKIPLGSFRLQLPGNPEAIGAALASGRFPGVLAPYPVEAIYPLDDPDNRLLHKMLARWLYDPAVEEQMTTAYLSQNPGGESQERWGKTYLRWQQSESMRKFFPQKNDVYVDGGAIDNTPSNSAVDSSREWVESQGLSKREVELDLYIIFLHPEPVVDEREIGDLPFHQVLTRTLEIQGAAKQSSDAVVVDTINTFGQRAESLGDALMVVLKSYQDHLKALSEEQRMVILDDLQQQARDAQLRGFLGRSGEGILERIEAWAEDIIDQKLPMHINKVIIYPDEMPMSTLQFSERLGYRQDNAVRMLTMGCYRTLEAIFNHLVKDPNKFDPVDQTAFDLTLKWMGIQAIPKNQTEVETSLQNWKCQRTTCVFHTGICPRGAAAV